MRIILDHFILTKMCFIHRIFWEVIPKSPPMCLFFYFGLHVRARHQQGPKCGFFLLSLGHGLDLIMAFWAMGGKKTIKADMMAGLPMVMEQK